MTAGFEDIAIDDLDLRKTTWSRVHSSMRTLYLKLSREPDIHWIRFFHEERESRIVLKRHGLWIEDGYIVFDCLLADVERHHLPDFRLSVDYANQKCRELALQRQEDSVLAREVSLAEQRQLDELRRKVRAGREEEPPAAAAGPAVEAHVPAEPGVDGTGSGFDARRDDWRARFRAAMAAQNKESDRVD